jgi:hypothetical protein
VKKKTPTTTPAETMVDLVTKLAHEMQTAPVADVIVASVSAFNEFQAIFYGFLGAQRAFKSDASIQIVGDDPPPGVRRH